MADDQRPGADDRSGWRPAERRSTFPPMPILERFYTGALVAARAALPLLARGEGKLARGIRGRRGVVERLEAWARAERDPARPLVWFHAPSVGEGLQARAVIEELRVRWPEAQVVYT
ncbi:MAG TPA: glycosyltransferase N-terminal domain-containing protein, partial [Longimicrobiaceae bacterium]|nr:glycosyltransferase N-terminal domain-containing protein [Longimicrobiaceae bacterium]